MISSGDIRSVAQAMADFYLGLMRFRRGDFEGALSCFRSALDKDRGSFLLPARKEVARRGEENVERYLYQADWATFWCLAARCWRELDEEEEASGALERARAARPRAAEVLERFADPRNNVLAVIEAGRAPRKEATGPRGALLAYRPALKQTVTSVTLDGRPISFALSDDVAWQAMTLGGRQVDELNVAKARRQEALEAIGITTAIAGGLVALASSDRRVRNAGLIALGVGVVTTVLAEAAIDARADTRAWTLLPGTLLVAVARAPPGAVVELRVAHRIGGHSGVLTRRARVPRARPLVLPIRLLPPGAEDPLAPGSASEAPGAGAAAERSSSGRAPARPSPPNPPI